MTKKVLIMTQNFYPVIGSAGNRMKNIFQLLNENNIETEVLTTEPAYPNKNMYKNREFWDDETINQQSHKITRVSLKNSHYDNRLFFYVEIMVRFFMNLWKYRNRNYDYLYVSSPPIFIVFSALLGKHILKSKIILEIRDLWPDSLTGVKTFDNKFIIQVFRWLEKMMYNKADIIVINSEGFRNHIRSKLKNRDKPMIYLPNGPRKSEMVNNFSNNKTFRVVYTGNVGLAQDIDRLKLISKLLDEKNIPFDIIGYGIKLPELKQFIKEKSLKNVNVYEPTTRKKSLEMIKKSDVAIAFLNDEEVFETVLPGKIIDYMSCGTPVIAGVKGIAAKVITENDAGYTFEYEDTESMVAKIEELKNNPEKRKRLSYNCKKAIEDQFLWETNIEKLLKLINN